MAHLRIQIPSFSVDQNFEFTWLGFVLVGGLSGDAFVIVGTTLALAGQECVPGSGLGRGDGRRVGDELHWVR